MQIHTNSNLLSLGLYACHLKNVCTRAVIFGDSTVLSICAAEPVVCSNTAAGRAFSTITGSSSLHDLRMKFLQKENKHNSNLLSLGLHACHFDQVHSRAVIFGGSTVLSICAAEPVVFSNTAASRAVSPITSSSSLHNLKKEWLQETNKYIS